MRNSRMRDVGNTFKAQMTLLGGFVLVFWVLEVLDQVVFQGRLDRFGILPRTAVGLRGIVFGPFLHAGFGHVLANTIPFLALGWLVMVRSRRDFWVVTGVTAVVSGAGIWLTGPSRTVHIGASGLIFGYFGYLLLRGYFERSLQALSLSLLVLFLYGSMIWGVLPQRLGVSWQAHLFGFIGGGVAAYWLSRRETALSAEEEEPLVIDWDDLGAD